MPASSSRQNPQYTPGPWKFKTDPFTGDCGLHAESTGIFAEAFADIHHQGERNRAGALANARLIAAAPDLLEALKVLFESYKRLADSGDAGFWKIEDHPEGKQALAAIAKAEGRS